MASAPAEFLERNVGLLPVGRALDLAAGEGANAVFLARMGFCVDAVDRSEERLERSNALAAEQGVRIRTILADLETYDLGEERYELVADFRYLQRDLTPRIKRALKPGGVVIFETFTTDQFEFSCGPKRREYLLERGELRSMFEDFEILHWSETKRDRRAVASLIARKETK